MPYLDFERLEAIDPVAYQGTRPFPWVNPEGLIHDAGFEALVETLPDLSLFEKVYGMERAHGQRPHDRYNLEYSSDLELSEPWTEFLAELTGGRYHDALCRIIGVGAIDLRFHWHYQPAGCSVSPHCDSKKKLGSHLFYFNTARDWRPEWGGQTLILDDRGRFDRKSAPEIGEFDQVQVGKATGNVSLLFTQCGNSWHAVDEIRCPEGVMRKVFIVVLNRVKPLAQVSRRLRATAGF